MKLLDIFKKESDETIPNNGFELKSHGKVGTIYYKEDSKILEIDLEVSGVSQFDILISFENIKNWNLPKNQKITISEKNLIRDKLIEFLKSKRLRVHIA